MNTFHLASLALLAGLISAAPTSTYRHVDAVVPEIEFADVDDAVYNLVTFTIDPTKTINFVQWITKLAEMSYMCEKGTTVYSVYEGHWQVEKDKPAVVDPITRTVIADPNKAEKNTYTIFEKFSSKAGADAHGTHTPGTAIVMWRTERNDFTPAVGPGRTEVKDKEGRFALALTVTHPTGEVFDELMKLGKVVVKPEEKKLNGELCGGYPKVEPKRMEPEHAEPEHVEPEHAKPLLAKQKFAREFGQANKKSVRKK